MSTALPTQATALRTTPSTQASQATPSKRTPDDIAFELSSYRDGIRAGMQSHETALRAAHARPSAPQLANKVLLRMMGFAQQYMHTFMQTNVTPSAIIQFVAKRPLMVGVVAAATAGVVVMAGPRRLFGWAAKASAVWRAVDIFASAIRRD